MCDYQSICSNKSLSYQVVIPYSIEEYYYFEMENMDPDQLAAVQYPYLHPMDYQAENLVLLLRSFAIFCTY